MTELKPGWQRVKFGDVVRLNKETCKDPAAAGIARVIGLEHLEPGDLRVRSWSDVADGTTFTNRVRPGQVLFGKRRAYQRKVAVADFDAVCSGDIYVLESANSELLLPGLLPFLCQTDAFFEHAVGTSAGSLSPRTNWKSLSQFELMLPPLEEQNRALHLFKSIEKARITAQEALDTAVVLLDSAAQEVLLHRFLQNLKEGRRLPLPADWKQMTIADMCERITYGFTNPMPTEENGPWMITAKDIASGRINYETARRTSREAFEEMLTAKSKPQPGDVLLTKDGTLGRVGIVDRPDICVNQSVAVLRPKPSVPSRFLAWSLRSPAMQNRLFQDIGGTAVKHLYITKVGAVELAVPDSTEKMEQLSDFLSAVENSVSILQSKLAALKAFSRHCISLQNGYLL